MAPTNRLRYNNQFGSLGADPGSSGTTITFGQTPGFPTIADPNYVAIVLDPDSATEEIVWLTAYTSGQLTGTISRGQEGTTGVAHPSGTWRHGPTAQDFAGPIGTLGYAQVTSNQGSITTAVDLTGLSVTVTVGSGRRIKISAEIMASNDTATSGIILYIVEGSTFLQEIWMPETTAGWALTLIGSVILTPSAGSHTYKLQMARNGTIGTVTANATANSPAFILVEDIGT